jgi:hypothetical protein
MRRAGNNRRQGPRNSNVPQQENSQFSVVSICRFPGIGFPDKLLCTLKYCDSASFNSTPTPSSQVYSCNSLYDPDVSGSGHQPLNFDQFASLYETYVVVGATVKLEYFNNSGTVPCYVTAGYSPNVLAYTVDNLVEGKYFKKGILGLSSAGNSIRVINLPYMSTAEIFGTKFVEGDPDYYTPVSTNPTKQWYVTIKGRALDGVTNLNFTVRSTILYDVVFKGHKVPTPS